MTEKGLKGQSANVSGKSAVLGAAFLMATSAIGPGFQTQVSVFTQELLASFGFVILLTVLVDVATQLNTWRVLTVSGMRAQDLANKIIPGLGFVLAILVLFGGIAFNIGNIAGCGLGLNVLFGMDIITGAVLSGVIALVIFWMKEANKALDTFTKILGGLMVLLTMYVAISSQPHMGEAVKGTFMPDKFSMFSIITIIGGSVGGYIAFVGAHRLLDAGIQGTQNLSLVNRSVYSGIALTATMRTLLFLAALGVVSGGVLLDKANPPASVFRSAAGELGYRFFGMVMWSAAITSVVGAAYTSVSFFRTLHFWFDKYYRQIISFIIVLSVAVFIVAGNPVNLLIIAGAVNGFILPISLSLILIATHKKSIVGNYNHPFFLRFAGWVVVAIMGFLSVYLIKNGGGV
jgi:Mn2+/Fe2+ NRAMP family transporter